LSVLARFVRRPNKVGGYRNPRGRYFVAFNMIADRIIYFTFSFKMPLAQIPGSDVLSVVVQTSRFIVNGTIYETAVRYKALGG
jgi:hypothetical protein